MQLTARLSDTTLPSGPFMPVAGDGPLAASVPTRAWPITILGVTFDPLTLHGAIDRIENMIEGRQPRYVVTPNVDFLVQAQHDAELHQILAQADLVLCDGKPLVWASRWLGNVLPGRVAGSDLVPMLLHRAEKQGWRIFLLGGATGVAAEAARRMALAHPSLPAVEYYSPPHRPLADMDNADIIERVRAAKPDIVLVCFGCPKQEKWIFRNYRALDVPVTIGAGGTVDFLAGRLKRAPQWMRRSGSEWLFRLWKEPRRLFRRYAGNLIHFFPALLAQRFRLPPSHAPSAAQGAPSSANMIYGLKVHAAGSFHGDVLQRTPGFWTQTAEQPGHCVLDLSGVQSIDSTGLAFLAHWQRRLARDRRNLILHEPSLVVRAALAHMHLTDQFVITPGKFPAARANSVADETGQYPWVPGAR
jgi:N-acetylglucosaminyldiphosphoundecaprenol N-acetyl-beta-D-mannosaminyltransferase